MPLQELLLKVWPIFYPVIMSMLFIIYYNNWLKLINMIINIIILNKYNIIMRHVNLLPGSPIVCLFTC